MTVDEKPQVTHAGKVIPEGWGRIAFHASYGAAAFMAIGRNSWVELWIGQENVVLPWGDSVVDVPAGRHSLRARTVGSAIDGPAVSGIEVTAGATVPLYYRAPSTSPRASGALGTTPQRTRGEVFGIGAWIFAGLSLVVAVITLCAALSRLT